MTRRAAVKEPAGFVQPDLFGEFDAEAERRAQLDARRAADRARYGRRSFIAAYDTVDVRAGDEVLGWECPACHAVEWSEFTLALNHGYEPGRFEAWPGQWAGDAWGVECHRTMKRGYREEHRMPGLPHLEDRQHGIGVTIPHGE